MNSIDQIVTAAAAEIGLATNVSIGDGSPSGILADLNVQQIINAELERYHYSFAQSWAKLTQEVEGHIPNNQSFLLPNDCIICRNIYIEPQGVSTRLTEILYSDWEESGGKVHVASNAPYSPPKKFILEYTTSNTSPDKWGENFKLGIKFRIAAIFSRSLAMNSVDGDRYDAMANEHFTIARSRSSRRYNGSKLFKGRGRLMTSRMVRRG